MSAPAVPIVTLSEPPQAIAIAVQFLLADDCDLIRVDVLHTHVHVEPIASALACLGRTFVLWA